MAHSIFTFPWAFTKSFGLPWPNYHIIYFWGLLAFALTRFTNSFFWAPSAHLCLLSTSYDSHELTTSFSGLPWARFLSLGPFLLLYRLVDHYFCHLGLMVFLTLLVLLHSPLLYCWASSCYWALLPKWASTNMHVKFRINQILFTIRFINFFFLYKFYTIQIFD